VILYALLCGTVRSVFVIQLFNCAAIAVALKRVFKVIVRQHSCIRVQVINCYVADLCITMSHLY